MLNLEWITGMWKINSINITEYSYRLLPNIITLYIRDTLATLENLNICGSKTFKLKILEILGITVIFQLIIHNIVSVLKRKFSLV